jgi:hypothetical protein
VAIPENRTVAGAPATVAMTLGALTIGTRNPTPALPGGVGARTVVTGTSGVVVLENLNAAGTTVRAIALPAPAEPLPFRLLLLQ